MAHLPSSYIFPDSTNKKRPLAGAFNYFIASLPEQTSRAEQGVEPKSKIHRVGD